MRLTIENSTEDQQWFNMLLRHKNICRFLPSEKYWNIGQVGLRYAGDSNRLELIKSLVPTTILMFHANRSIGIQQKMELLEAVTSVIC